MAASLVGGDTGPTTGASDVAGAAVDPGARVDAGVAVLAGARVVAGGAVVLGCLICNSNTAQQPDCSQIGAIK